jgi:superfamily II DNA or RNA helicase
MYGFDSRPNLPELRIHSVVVDSGILDGLLPAMAQSLGERLSARRDTIDARCVAAAEIANQFNEPVLLWCNLNDEGDALADAVINSVQVAGSDTEQQKEDRMLGFTDGKYQKLITKPKIAGFGMNWQHCNKVIFVGLSDSWEQYYQAIRRCWRFGQKKPVDVYIVSSDIEGAVVANIKRKDDQSNKLMDEMAKIASACFSDFSKAKKEMKAYQPKVTSKKPKWSRK